MLKKILVGIMLLNILPAYAENLEESEYVKSIDEEGLDSASFCQYHVDNYAYISTGYMFCAGKEVIQSTTYRSTNVLPGGVFKTFKEIMKQHGLIYISTKKCFIRPQ